MAGEPTLAYQVLDVFTDRPYAGNPLAVVLDADALATAQMQAVAREFHLSETAFPLRPSAEEASAGVTYRLRIFTPATELPFAGHPSVGTAWLMVTSGRARPDGSGVVRQACGAGVLPLRVSDDGEVELTGATPEVVGPADPAPLLRAVGLTEADLAGTATVTSAGLGYAVLPVQPGAACRCVPDSLLLRRTFPAGSQVTGVYVVEVGVAAAGEPVPVEARMFAWDVGVDEDAATGSAALALGPYLVAAGVAPGDGECRYDVRQGVDMGRPSLLRGRVVTAAGRPVEVAVAGRTVPVASGRVSVPPG